MNQNDMDRYRWRTGQRWSGDRVSGRRGASSRDKFPLLLIIIGACVAFELLLSFHGCGRQTNAFFHSRQQALQQRQLTELHDGSKNAAEQFAEALKAADTHTVRSSAVPQSSPKPKNEDPLATQFTGVTKAYDAAVQKSSQEKK